ncbi:hypothetical protein [Luteimonas aquatica]|uniref:hypothetical protein n=1 Tax=Luteimonas aquatica TaxID=450364 RepID=UPI001F5A1A32|nr:hypothetical protein [Luteimonas aquatica]
MTVRNPRSPRHLLLASLLALAGPLWAGEDATPAATPAAPSADPQALVAEYQVRDAQGERTLVLVRDATRVEYRLQDAPVQLWRQTGDGIAQWELFPRERRAIALAPGDLRTINRVPEWAHLAGLIDPGVRAGLQRDGQSRAFEDAAIRYRGRNAQGERVTLEWLEAGGLPARYRIGARYELRLRKLQRVPADAAFTALDGYRESDYADLGDMELDPFVAAYLHRQGNGHAH